MLLVVVVTTMMFKEEGSPSQITELDKMGVVVIIIILYSIGDQAAGFLIPLSLTHGILVGMVHRIGRLPIIANFLPLLRS
jgi:hypothetical protein